MSELDSLSRIGEVLQHAHNAGLIDPYITPTELCEIGEELWVWTVRERGSAPSRDPDADIILTLTAIASELGHARLRASHLLETAQRRKGRGWRSWRDFVEALRREARQHEAAQPPAPAPPDPGLTPTDTPRQKQQTRPAPPSSPNQEPPQWPFILGICIFAWFGAAMLLTVLMIISETR